ncbi:MAG: hypothetical protein ACE5IE_04710 [Dehalococcoidia bacterium]
MRYKHINRRKPTPEGILAYLGRTDVPITDVAVTQGYSDEGEPFVEVDFGPFQLSTKEQRRLATYLGDVAPDMEDFRARLEMLESRGPVV